mmetsp:Transcript_33612/g.78557  ORF Transcript_33612/g.78557 Transcript_33612/m.78557 type:complete len:280 (-) Transcript_33612:256-1095(-)
MLRGVAQNESDVVNTDDALSLPDDLSQDDGARVDCIAVLQELLQSPAHTSMLKYPPRVRVLHWEYLQNRKVEGVLMFRAVLAFLCNGVPHHVAGRWHRCKKHARRSSAEVALVLVKCLHLSDGDAKNSNACVDLSRLTSRHSFEGADPEDPTEARVLEGLLSNLPFRSSGLDWIFTRNKQTFSWSASIGVCLSGAQYTFLGPDCQAIGDAQAELARRVLWYLGCSDYSSFYYPDRRRLLLERCEVPAAPPRWLSLLVFKPPVPAETYVSDSTSHESESN